MSEESSLHRVGSTSFINEDKEINKVYNIDKNKYREQEQHHESKEGALSAWFRPDTGNGNGYGHQSLVPLRQHMYSLPIYTRRLQVLTYALAEISSAATLIADYTRSLLNLSRRLVICWESVLHAALMWQHVEKQTHRVVLQCVKRTWYKLHYVHSTHTSQKCNKNKNNNHGLSHKHHYFQHHHSSANNKFNVVHKNAHSIHTSSSSSPSPSSITHSSLSLPKLTHSFAHHIKQSKPINKGARELNNKSEHSLEEEELEEEKEEEEQEYEELEEQEKENNKFGALLHKSEKEKKKACSEMWCKVQVAVLMNKHIHKLVRRALRHYYKHENIVASQLEKLRSTIVAAILQQFLTVHVKESYHDTLLHSWLPRPQQNELINVSHSLIHSHVCNIISKLQNEEYKEHELYQSNEYHREEEEESEKSEREYNTFYKDDKQCNEDNTQSNKISKKQKLQKVKECKELRNTSDLENLEKLLEEHHPNEHSLEHEESNQSDIFVLPTVIRKRHRSAAQSANNSKDSNSGNNNKKYKSNNARSNPVNSEKESKSKVKKDKQSASVPIQEEYCENEQSFLPKEEHATSYQYANWSNSLSLAFFMHAAASANSTLCALSVISRCVYNASHVISSDDESPQAWRRCRDWQNEHVHSNNNKHYCKFQKEGDINTPTTARAKAKWEGNINNKEKVFDTINAEEDDRQYFMEQPEEETEDEWELEKQEKVKEEAYEEKRNCKAKDDNDNDDNDIDEGFYYIIVAARAVNACNHSATCFGNRKFIFIECDDVETLLRRTEEQQQEQTEETASSKTAESMQCKTNIWDAENKEYSNEQYKHQTYCNAESSSQMNKYNADASLEEQRLIAQERVMDDKTRKHHEVQKSLEHTDTLPLIVKPNLLEHRSFTPVVANALQRNNTAAVAVANNDLHSKEYECNNDKNPNEMWLRSLLTTQHGLLSAPPPPSQKGEEIKCKTTLYNAEEDEEMEYVNMFKNNNSKMSANQCKSGNNKHFNEPCNREHSLHSCEECEENEDTNDENYSASSTDEPKFIVMNALYCSLATNTTHQRWSGNAESEDAEQLAIDDSSFHATHQMNMHNSKNDNYANSENNRTDNTIEGINNTDFRKSSYDHANNESALVLSQRVSSTSPVTLYESNHGRVTNARYYDPNEKNSNAFSNFAHTILMPPSSGQENTIYGSNDNYNRSAKSKENQINTKEQVPKLHIDDTSSVTPSEGDFAFAAELFARLQFWCVRGQDRSKFKACNLLPHTKHVDKHNACKDVENEETHKTKESQEQDQEQQEEKENELHKEIHGKEVEEEEEEEEEESEWRKEFVQRPVKLLSSSVGNMTFHFTRYGATVNNLHRTSETTGKEGNMNESAVFGANIRGQELLYEALCCTTHVVICEVRESRAHKDYHDALHVMSLPYESSINYYKSENNNIDEYIRRENAETYEYNNKKTHTATKKDTKNNELNKEYNYDDNDEDRFVELATLSDDEADPYWYDRQSKLDVRAVAEWAQGEMLVETQEPKKKKNKHIYEEEEYQNGYHTQHSCRKPLPNRERRQRRNEMLKNEFRLARSTRLDALLVDEVNDKPIATIVLEATHVPYTTNDVENTRGSANNTETINSPINISTEQAVQNTTYSVVSFSQYIAPLWDHMHREKAIMVDLDRTLVDNAILVSSSSSSSSSLSLSPSQSLLISSSSSSSSMLLLKKKMDNKTNESLRLPSQVQQPFPRSVLHSDNNNDDNNNCNSCWNEQTDAKFSEIAELLPSLLQQRIRAKNSHNNNNTNIDALNKVICTSHSQCNTWQPYAYRCRVSYPVCLSAHTDDTVADFSQPLIHEVIYIRPDVRTWLHHMSIRWNIPLILVTKSTRLRAQAILSQLLDPCQLLFTNESRQLITSCQVEHAKKLSLESDKSVNHFNITASTETVNNNNSGNSEKCQRQQITSKSAYHVLRIFDCVDETHNYTNWPQELHHKEILEKEEMYLCKRCQARSIAIVDDAVQVWEAHDWPRAIAIAPYTLSRVDPVHYLSVNGGYITSLVLSALYSKKELTCPFAELPTCVLHNAQNIRAMNNLYKTRTEENIKRYDKMHCICSCVAPCCTAAIEQRRQRKREQTRHVDRSIKQFHMYYTSPVIESSSNLPRLPPIPITPQITQEPEVMKHKYTSKAIMNQYDSTNTAIIGRNKLISTRKTSNTRNANSITTPFSTSSTLSSTNSSRSLSSKEWEEEEYWSSSSSEEEEEEEEEDLQEITPVSVISSKENSTRPSELVKQHLTEATQGSVQEHQEHFTPLPHNRRHKHARKAHMTPPTPIEFASQSQTNLLCKNNKKNITTPINNNNTITTINIRDVHDKCIPNSTEQKCNTLQNKETLEPPNQEHLEQQQQEQEEEEEEVEDVVNAEEAVVDEGADEDVNVFAQANTNDTFDWQFNKKNKSSSIWADDTVEDVVPL